MKIVAGLGTIEDYEAYVAAGADELFVGYVPYRWQRYNELSMPLNRREVSYVNVNIGSQSEMEILADKVRKIGVLVTVTLNGLNYAPSEYGLIKEIINDLVNIGFENYIIADMGLLVYLNETGIASKINIHISGEIGEMNSYQVGLFKDLGVKRIIYHRGVSIENLELIIKKYPELEHEVFYMNENCHFTGGYCNSLHCDELTPMCKMPYIVGDKNGKEISLPMANQEDEYNCSRCGVDYLFKIGVTHIKIVGRGASIETMIESITKSRKEVSIQIKQFI